MKVLNVVVEGSAEEAFVNGVLRKHLAQFEIYVYCRKIQTGWDAKNKKPAKGGLFKYSKFRKDITNWIEEKDERNKMYFSSFIDLYAFPTGSESPFTERIQNIIDPYVKVVALEEAIKKDINCLFFIPYIQLHEFEAFLLVKPDNLLIMYPEKEREVERLKSDINNLEPEKINETPLNAPSKRIIKYIPEYEGQKAQVGPLVAENIGIETLRIACPHFNEWLSKIERL